jgi:hypothetical protein
MERYGKLCKEILNLDPKIRFAGICDDTGEIKYGSQREGVKNLLSPEETKKSNLQALSRWGLRNALAPKVGKGRYAMAEYERIKRITIPLEDDNLLLVTTEVEVDHVKIINDVWFVTLRRSFNYNKKEGRSIAFLLPSSIHLSHRS